MNLAQKKLITQIVMNPKINSEEVRQSEVVKKLVSTYQINEKTAKQMYSNWMTKYASKVFSNPKKYK